MSDPTLQHTTDQTTAADGLTITVSKGTGIAATALGAFDAALIEAGIANFNLITLSSVIPPGATIVIPDQPGSRPGGWGDRLYVVLAETRVEKHNEEAWAGIGWTQEAATGRGLFVEHHGYSRHQVEADIDASLSALIAGRPGIEFGSRQSVVQGIVCEDQPVCSLVAAAFLSVGWQQRSTMIDLRTPHL